MEKKKGRATKYVFDSDFKKGIWETIKGNLHKRTSSEKFLKKYAKLLKDFPEEKLDKFIQSDIYKKSKCKVYTILFELIEYNELNQKLTV